MSKNKRKMNNFKLIGIRPHKDCSEKFLKVLEPGRLYQFYNEYEFYTEKGKFDGVNGEIIKYKFKQTVPENLYKVGNLNINVSAIVGKNGTGKSTLIELLLYCVYYLGTNIKNRKGENILHPHQEHVRNMIVANEEKIKDYSNKKKEINDYVEKCLMPINELAKKDDRKRLENFAKKQNKLLNIGFSITDLEKRQHELRITFESATKEHKNIIDTLKCDLLFEIDKTLYIVKIGNKVNFSTLESPDINTDNLREKRDIKLISILNPKSTELLNTFFYSIVLNYSHHSLNSKHLGYWINTLFHKNDGYKTPAVINPMRKNGTFDINDEINLAKTRLLVNLLVDCLVNKNKNPLITDNQRIQKVRFRFNKNKSIGNDIRVGNQSSENPKDHFIIAGKNINLLKKLYDISFIENDTSIYNNSLPFNEIVHNYISEKAMKIQEQYPEYVVKWKELDNIFTATDRYAQDLVDDNSHITFKLKQALYFLEKTAKDGNVGKWNQSEKYFDFGIDELLSWMEINEVEELHHIFTRIPPSVFIIDFLLVENIEVKKNPTLFEDLSSGEQQKIHTINSIIYHLNNLYSVHLSKSEEERIKYHNLNIILDEIELYYHPDLQRKFIYDLIETIKSHKHLVTAEYIKGMNFIFSTHSPFILSDIPEQNILKLNYQKSSYSDDDNKYSVPLNTKRQTFGANIHDLLANSFFLHESYKGEFAQNYFHDLINAIKNLVIVENTSIEDYKLWKMKIDLIAEPFIKSKLFEILDSKFEDIVNPLDEKIGRMEDAIEKLKKQKEVNQKEKEDDTNRS
jgi:predicted ATPase